MKKSRYSEEQVAYALRLSVMVGRVGALTANFSR
jgi:hypothetical protein